MSGSSSSSSSSSLAKQQSNLMLSGYLYKRSHHNTFKKWNRRWFTLINSKLFYQKKNELSSGVNEMEPDLRVCKVREVNDGERRFTFEIVSPKCRHILQADSQKDCTLWIKSIDKAINDAINNLVSNQYGSIDYQSDENSISLNEFTESIDILNSFNEINNCDNLAAPAKRNHSFRNLKELEKSSSSASLKKRSEITENKNSALISLKGNQVCCDCGAPNPSWVKLEQISFKYFF